MYNENFEKFSLFIFFQLCQVILNLLYHIITWQVTIQAKKYVLTGKNTRIAYLCFDDAVYRISEI